jgi:hypothetical protein
MDSRMARQGRFLLGMSIIKPALVAVLAIGFSLTGAFAKDAKTTSRSKSSQSSASAKKKKTSTTSASSRSKKSSSKAKTAKRASASTERFDGFLEEIPPEDLPMAEGTESPEQHDEDE